MTRVRRNDTYRFDASKRTREGYIDTIANITKTGVFEYRRADGTIQRELRLAEHVFSQAHLDSIHGQPMTLIHPTAAIDAKSFKKQSVGVTLDPRKADDGIHLQARVRVMDAEAIRAVDSGIRELSCGYETELVEIAGGVFRRDDVNGGAEIRADFLQTEILNNHTALVPVGRAGPTARLDSAGHQGAESIMNEEEMKKALAAAEKLAAELKQKNDALEGEAATLKVQLADAEKVEKERSKKELISRVAPAIKKDAKDLEKLDEASVMREALKVLQPSMNTDGWVDVALKAGLEVALKSAGTRADAATTLATVVAGAKQGEIIAAREDAADEHASDTAYQNGRRAAATYKPGKSN